MLKDFRAFQLSKEFYQRCKKLKLPLFLSDQLIRASASIALNLAESSGRRTEKERIRFSTIAFGSLKECEAILSMEEITDPVLLNILGQLNAILFKLCRFERKLASLPIESKPESGE